MKVERVLFFCLIVLGMQAEAALTPISQADTSNNFLVVENNNDDNFFITTTVLDPRMTGSNKWTGLKYSGSGGSAGTQQSLGYISTYVHYQVTSNAKLDMWLDDSPVKYPLSGWRCINWYAGCNLDTSMIEPAVTDSEGFYGAQNVGSGAKWLHGMMSDSFYRYLQQMPVGSNFTTTINACYTTASYDARAGERCRDQSTGYWRTSKVTHTKIGHLKIMNTNALQEVFINSDGEPTLGEGNASCRPQTIGSLSGLSCKMVNYTLQTTGISNSSIRVYPVINHAALLSAVGTLDMQFSLDGSNWKRGNNDAAAYSYNFNDLKSADAIYIFMSKNLFKKMVELGISDASTKDLFNFRFINSVSVESGYYEFSTSNELIIKPRDFSISIISDEYTTAPTREGYVGSGEPSLDFGYIVTTSGKTAADSVYVKVTGPTQTIGGYPYCIFSSPDGTVKVPFPAHLSLITREGTSKKIETGCGGYWHDMTDALWQSTPWTDISGDIGLMNKTTLKFSIPMDNAVSLRTVDDNGWFGEVSASGEIHVEATWLDID